MTNLKLNLHNFLKYKFLNSMFLGLSVGSIFILYTPLKPSIYSIGGIALALGMLMVANYYEKILNIYSFYKISLFVELILLLVVGWFLLFSYSYTTALIVYAGYQFTFVFGSYLIRAETLFVKKSKALGFIDIAKQKGYLLGMLLSYLFYQFLEYQFVITDKQREVYLMHFILIFTQSAIIFYLIKSFKQKNKLYGL